MGSISTGIGLISGIDYGAYIDAIIMLESRGKTTLQQRIASLQAQQTAMLDINARLLNLKNAAHAFKLDSIFRSALAMTSDEAVLTATASTSAQPGSYTFIVQQLVANSQKLSRGFTDRDATPVGLSSMSFEFGKGALSTDTALENLNGGNGVDRGRIIITDRADNQATIDLTDVTNLDEVIERINGDATISVTAAVDGDNLVLTDTSGGSGTLTVENYGSDITATDLGIAGSAAGDVLTGAQINMLGVNTALGSLNDGNGVLIRNNVADFTITARDGTEIEVDLGRLTADITTDTLLEDLNNGLGVTISDDDENADIKLIDREGNEYEVNLTGVTTVGGLITRVSNETGGRIELSITNGERLTVTDTVGGAGLLKVLGAGDNGTDTAEDLGILNAAGAAADSFDGELIPNTVTDAAGATLGAVIDRINESEGNDGKIVASLGDDGVSIKLTDATGGGGNLIVAATAANPNAAADLGIETAGVASDTLEGQRLIAAMNSVLVRNLNGGSGLDGATTVTITDRSGTSFAVNDLGSYLSLSQIIDRLNEEADANGVSVTVGYNAAGTGLLVTDSSGVTTNNLSIAGDGATALGIEADVAANSVTGSNVQLQYVSEATLLEDLDYGRGVGAGSFRITDGLGNTATVSIDSDSETLYDVIQEINSRGLAVQARVNDNGDGLIIEADLDPEQTAFVPIKVETVSGSTAQDLNIVGESEEVMGEAYIDGSYEQVVDLTVSDTLSEVVAKINDAGVPVAATIISTGSGATPYRLNLTSMIGGAAGELLIGTEGEDLGLTTLTEGRDAKVFFGADTPEEGFLITSGTNTITDLIDGVTIDLLSASEDPVTITVQRDEQTIIDAVSQFVTTFNDAVGRIDDYDYFNTESEERGVLLGNGTTSLVRSSLFRLVQSRVDGVDGQYQYLSQVGISVGQSGQLEFDQERFKEAYDADPEAVADLFAAYEASSSTTEEIAPGVTVTTTETTATVRGFGEMFNDLLDYLTNSIDGVMTLADESFADQIVLAERRIETIDGRLEARRAQLEREFLAMETTISLLQGQYNALTALSANVGLAQSAANTSGFLG